MWYVVLGFFAALFLGLSIYFFYSFKKNKDESLESHAKEVFYLEELRELKYTIQIKEQECKNLNSQIVLQKEKNSSIDELNAQKENLQEQIIKLNNLIDEKIQILNEIKENEKNSNDKLKILNEDCTLKILEKQAVLEETQGLSMKLSENRIELERIIEELEDKKNFNRLAIINAWSENHTAGNSNSNRWFFELSGSDKKLQETIALIQTDYPDLSIELGSIIWRRIWMPKIQSWVKMYGLDGKKGIYKITLKDDESVCYIGQSTDIKTRWYTHIKKMIGAEAKGGEKLYSFTPDMFGWEVLCECKPGKEMDEKERYWIEYFGAIEVGLNKK